MSDLKDIWKSQDTEYAPMALDDIRAQAGKFHSRIRLRNFIELTAAVIVVATFGFYIWVFPDPLMRAGSVLIILGTLYVAWQLRRRAKSHDLPGSEGASWADYYRSELLRQRDALGSVWKWYLAPLVPGMALFIVGLARVMPQAALGRLAAFAVVCAVFFVAVGLLNSWAARRLQKKIDALGG
jgi:hypothetical protein